MPLSAEERQNLFDVIARTGQARAALIGDRVIPEDYRAHTDNVVREEQTMEFDGLAPVRVIITRAKELAESAPIHVNMHGGGYWFHQNEDDDLYCAHIADCTHGVVVDVDYATSPEYPFPMCFEQSYAVAKWAAEHAEELGASPKRLSVGGLSAGGCLAAAIALRASATHDFDICLEVLDCAAIDNVMATKDGKSERNLAFSTLLCDGDFRLLESPYCSPAYAVDSMLAGLPKTLVVNAGSCPFREPNELYGSRLAAQGVPVTIKCFTKSRHGFTVRMADEWQAAQDIIIRFINESGL